MFKHMQGGNRPPQGKGRLASAPQQGDGDPDDTATPSAASAKLALALKGFSKGKK